MKKMLSLLVIAMFVFSMAPLAFAEDDDKPRPVLLRDRAELREKLNDSDLQQIIRTRTEIRREISEGGELRERIKERVDFKSDFERKESRERLEREIKASYKKREVSKEKLEKAKRRYQEASEKYEKAKSEYRIAKKRFDDAVSSGDDAQASEVAKEFLIDAADMIIETLNKIKEKAEGSDDLTEEEIAEIVADVDAKIAELEVAKQDVLDAQTKAEIKKAGAVIVKTWGKTKEKVKQHANKVVAGEVGEIVSRSTSLVRKMDRVLNRLNASGVDVSELQDDVDEYFGLIDEAKSLYNQAREESDVEQGKALLREAHETLKEAHELLKDVVKSVKKKGGDLDDDDEVCIENECEDVDEEDEEESIEIKAKIVGNQTFVEIEINDEHSNLTLETTDEDEIIQAVAEQTGLTVEEVTAVIEIEIEDADEEDDCVVDSDCSDGEVCQDGECDEVEINADNSGNETSTDGNETSSDDNNSTETNQTAA